MHSMVPVEITPRNASFAKACPQRVQLDVLRPCEPLPPPPFLEKLFQAGHDYEGETCADLCAGIEGARVIEVDDPDAREWHTMQAMSGGARVVGGGRLPVDHEAHRVGEPDLLVRDGDPAGSTDPATATCRSTSSPTRSLDAGPEGRRRQRPRLAASTRPSSRWPTADPEHDARWRVDDLLQLAHYRRLLEEAGCASPLRNVGGICGSEGWIVWYDLDEPVLDPSEYLAGAAPPGRLSAMERYDLEFAHRLAVSMRRARRTSDDAAAPLLAEPIVCAQCEMCQLARTGAATGSRRRRT